MDLDYFDYMSDSPITGREIRLLDYDTIRQMLAKRAVTFYGEERAREILPASDYREVKDALRKTSQACALLENRYFQLQRVPEVRPYLERLGKGGVLGAEELCLFISFLQGCSHMERSSQKEGVREAAPLLASLMKQVQVCRPLLDELSRCLTVDGEILDEASSLLKDLRRQARSLRDAIRDKLDHYIKSSSYQKHLQEAIVTVRNGRYVIPVKQEHRSSLNGVVHDHSSSGATVFIEPFPVVELQNKLQRVEREEQEELDRLLRELSQLVNTYYQDLSDNVYFYGLLDLLMARGELSLAMGGTEPGITGERTIELRGARHPLLEEAVPVDVEIGEDTRVMVITGPNTGGKTVTLKTAGLLVAMAQSGIHLPVLPGTRVGVFKGILADIGDEQSLEQSLSTFSGHLQNIIEILEKADSGSLVLLDELGAGTDPSEGAALARSILLDLYRKGSLVVATTHINELKLFAQLQEGMQNASMEFDENTFSPTYKLLQGVPGKSNALAIAERLGLPRAVMQEARKYLEEGHSQVEDMIGNLTRQQQKLRDDSLAADRERERVEDLRRQLEKEKEEFKQQKEEMLKEARQEARSVVKKAKKNADASLQELQQLYEKLKREAQADSGTMHRAEEVRHSLKEELESTAEELETETEEEYHEAGVIDRETLREGQEVWIKSLKQKGTVLKLYPSEEMLQVQVGALKVNTRLNDIAPLKDSAVFGKETRGAGRSYTLVQTSDRGVEPEISVRGMTLEEAIEKVDRYIDNAVMSGLNEVYLVHGKGTGTLRRGLQNFLKGKRWVQSWRLGDYSEGGTGVTVVKLGSRE